MCFPTAQTNLPTKCTGHTCLTASIDRYSVPLYIRQKQNHDYWIVHWVTSKRIQVRLTLLSQLCSTWESSLGHPYLGLHSQVMCIWQLRRGWYQPCCNCCLWNRSLYHGFRPDGFGYRSAPCVGQFECEAGGTHNFLIYSFFVHLPRFNGKVIAVPVVSASPSSLAFDFCLLARLDTLVQTSVCTLYGIQAIPPFSLFGSNTVV